MAKRKLLWRLLGGLLIVTTLGTAGCARSSGPKITTRALGSTPEDRVATVVKIIERHSALPGSIRSVEGLEEQVGDGRLGPSDFRFFAKIVVEKRDLSSWKSAAGAKLSSATYRAPQASTSWWLPESELKDLTLYSPRTLFGRNHGWIGFSSDNETLYVMTFTM